MKYVAPAPLWPNPVNFSTPSWKATSVIWSRRELSSCELPSSWVEIPPRQMLTEINQAKQGRLMTETEIREIEIVIRFLSMEPCKHHKHQHILSSSVPPVPLHISCGCFERSGRIKNLGFINQQATMRLRILRACHQQHCKEFQTCFTNLTNVTDLGLIRLIIIPICRDI